VAEDRARRLKVFRVLLEIGCRAEMPELMRCHVNADMPHDAGQDLISEGGLFLAAAPLRDEEMAIHVATKRRQDMTAIPSQMTCNLVRHLTDDVLLFAFRLAGCNVQEQLASRAIRLAEVVLPPQRAQVLRPKRQGEQDVDRNCNLGFDEPKTALFKILCNLPQQLLGKKQELGAKALGLQLTQDTLVL
jgi:hypothetical protein